MRSWRGNVHYWTASFSCSQTFLDGLLKFLALNSITAIFGHKPTLGVFKHLQDFMRTMRVAWFYLRHLPHSTLLLASNFSPLKNFSKQSVKLMLLLPMLTSLFLFVFHRWETIDCTQKSAIKYTYKVQSQEIFCFGLCVLAKTAYGFPLLQSLEHLRYECQVVVFIRLRDVLEIAKRGLDHVAQ